MLEDGERRVCLDPETAQRELCVGDRQDWVVIEVGGDNGGWTAVPPEMAESVRALRAAGVEIRFAEAVVGAEGVYHPLIPYSVVQQGVVEK